MEEEGRTTFFVPGSGSKLVYERDESGRLMLIHGGGRTYFDARDESRWVWDGRFVSMRHIELPGGYFRTVESCGRTWTENYSWNDRSLLKEIDGVQLEYDDEQRVIACRHGSSCWFYAYSGPYLTAIDTPRGLRHIIRGEDGRPTAIREQGSIRTFDYDGEGRRCDGVKHVDAWHFDIRGRLWHVIRDGSKLTFLWDRLSCIACIDGLVGDPLAAVYSLDPTGTPVRVIRRDGVRRIPRDAFGEALLTEPDTPGLFGGAVLGEFVHLPARRLHPLTGSFDAPDPLHGQSDDPRRAAGYCGPLPVELADSGPYTVCRNNPLALADPTGAISEYWWLIPSALTWSLQNTIGSLLGMWLNLTFSPIGAIVSAIAGRSVFDINGLSGKNVGAFALRSNGWLSAVQDQTWTYQFLVNQRGNRFDRLEDARLWVPTGSFRPQLYGTILQCLPTTALPFLLAGQRTPPNNAVIPGWSRAGGTAEAAFPGSQMPVFPSGGIHFTAVQRPASPQAAEMVELEPVAPLLFGTISNRMGLSISQTGLGLDINDLVFLTDEPRVAEIARVVAASEDGGTTLIRLDTDGTRLAGTGIRLRSLSVQVGTENLTPVPGQNTLLSVSGSSGDYVPAVHVVQLNRAAGPVGWAAIASLQVQLALTSPLPATLGNTLRIRPGVASGGSFQATLTATATIVEITTGTVPVPGLGMAIGPAGAAVGCLVLSVNGPQVTVDTDLSVLGGNGTAVEWQILSPLPSVGLRNGEPEAAAVVTYTPDRAGTAPAEFAWIEGSNIAIRRITGVNWDAAVLSQPLPDANSAPFSVDRFTLQALDISDLEQTQASVLALNAEPPNVTRAFHVLQLTGPAVMAGALIVTTTVVDDTASVPTNAAAGLQPGEVVVLQNATGVPEAAVIRRMRLTVTLTRDVPLNATGLEAVELAPTGPVYDGIQRGERVVRVRPFMGTDSTDMPRFAIGELIRVEFGGDERLFRVQSVSGTTITCEGDDIIPPGTGTVMVQRLTAQDPGTGSSRIGIDGEALAPNRVRFSVWAANAFDIGPERIGIIDGPNVFAVNVDNAVPPTLDVVFLSAPATTGANVEIRPIDNQAGSGFSTRFTLDGAIVNFNDAPLGMPGAGMVFVVPYIQTDRRLQGHLHNGNVRVPADHENLSLELDRHQSLVDHELTHTLQSAAWGPLLFAYFPLWTLELLGDFVSGMPEFGNYIPATIEEGAIVIPVADGVTLEADDYVQVAQNARAADIQLGSKDGDRFSLRNKAQQKIAEKGIGPGPAQVRREESGAGREFLEWFLNIMQFGTVGGLMNVVTVLGWGGVIWLVQMIVQAIRGAAHHEARATIADDHVTITLGTGEQVEDISPDRSLAIKQNKQLYVRPIDRVEDQTIVLRVPVPVTGNIQISLFETSSPLFTYWHHYFPATVPDPDRPSALRVQPLNDRTLRLEVDDRVYIRRSDNVRFYTVVTAVGADGTFEVEKPTLVRPGEPDELFVAKIGRDDPTGFLDQWFLDRMHISWMQYVHDPYGQIQYRARPTSTVGQIFARSARYAFGTQSWSLLPFFGYFWWDNAFKVAREEPFLSKMEQGASQRSGDTYSPIGTLHGDFSVVGDVARYWVTVEGGSRDDPRPTDMINHNLQDAPGVHLRQFPRFNFGVGTTNTALSVPFVFYLEDRMAATTPGGGLNFFGIGARGWIPASVQMERSAGIYVAFSRPSPATTSHEITSQGLAGIRNSEQAQDEGVSTISFARVVMDVTVTLATQIVMEGDVRQLIPFQRAVLNVVPDGARTYRVTVADPGFVASVTGTGLELTAVGMDRGTIPTPPGPTDDVEISRFYPVDASGMAVTGIGPVHLPSDIHIAVRRFRIELVNTLPLRSNLRVAATTINTVSPGLTGFLLVPARLASIPNVITVDVPSNPSPINPAITPIDSPPADVRTFIADGAALQIIFNANEPPEQTTDVTITVRVGIDVAANVPVTCVVTMAPFFTLERSDGGADFNVARGDVMRLQANDARQISWSPPDGFGGPQSGGEITISPPATATPGPLIILVNDSTNAAEMARRTITIT